MRRVSRHFPDYGWAWPRGDHDRLLRAALLADDRVSLREARGWLDSHDIDAASFREHRLLATVAERFGKAIASHRSYPRLIGLQRQLWTRSQLAVGEAHDTLVALASVLPIVLIKGASRAALDPAAQKGRVAHDIDLLVQPANMQAAFGILAAKGWRPSTGMSVLRAAADVPMRRSLNFFKGRSGDLDLHQAAYQPADPSASNDAKLWASRESAVFHGIPVFVPSAAERAALALAHGALDAHFHSDWLVDCAVALRTPQFPWSAFAEAIAREALVLPAAIVLTYLVERIEIELAEGFLERLLQAANAQPAARRIAALVQAKPLEDQIFMARAARALLRRANRHVLRQETRPRQNPAPRVLVGRSMRSRAGAERHLPDFAVSHAFRVPAASVSGPTRISIILRVGPIARARRIEMELNGSSRHLARLRFRTLRRRSRPLVLRFSGEIHFANADSIVTIEARPTRQIRDHELLTKGARFGAVPFQLLAVDFE